MTGNVLAGNALVKTAAQSGYKTSPLMRPSIIACAKHSNTLGIGKVLMVVPQLADGYFQASQETHA